MFTTNYIETSIEITRIQRGLADCLFHNAHLHTNGNECIACINATKYLDDLKLHRTKLRAELLA